jgi:hypothetical protein
VSQSEPVYRGGASGAVGVGVEPDSVAACPGRIAVVVVVGDIVVAGNGPFPSGSTTVVGPGSVGAAGLVGDVVSVWPGSVVVGVVVVVVVGVVVLGSCTLVRGTQVYSGSGMKPGGTT